MVNKEITTLISIQEKILNFLFLLTIILLPFNNLAIPWPVDSFNLSTCIAFLYCLIYSLIFIKKLMKSRFVAYLIFCTLIFIVISLIMVGYFYIFNENITFYKNREMLLQVIKSFLSFLILFLHGYFVFVSKDSNNFQKLMKYIIISNIIFIIYAIIEISIYLNVIKNEGVCNLLSFLNIGFNRNYFITSGGRIHGILYEPSVSTALVILTYIPLYLATIVCKIKIKNKIVLSLLILDVVFIFISRGRTGIAGFGFLIVLFIGIAILLKRVKVIAFFCIAVIALSILTVTILQTESATLFMRMSTLTKSKSEESANTRWGLMSSGIEVFLDYPLLGVGPGNFGFIGPKYIGSKVVFSELQEITKSNSDYWLHPFSFVIKYLCEFGLLGVLVFIVILSVFIRYLNRYKSLFIKIYLLFAFAAVVVVSLSTPVYHNFYYFIPLLCVISFNKWVSNDQSRFIMNRN